MKLVRLYYGCKSVKVFAFRKIQKEFEDNEGRNCQLRVCEFHPYGERMM